MSKQGVEHGKGNCGNNIDFSEHRNQKEEKNSHLGFLKENNRQKNDDSISGSNTPIMNRESPNNYPNGDGKRKWTTDGDQVQRNEFQQ